MASQARGLQNFISDLRNAKSKEEETRRVDKELANIRRKFSPSSSSSSSTPSPSTATSNPSLSSYQRKKYVWKLVYIHVLGYDVDFGHGEVIKLVRSNKFSEKQVGYVALSLLFRGGDPMMSAVVDTIRGDLAVSSSPAGGKKSNNDGSSSKGSAQNDDTAQSLALCKGKFISVREPNIRFLGLMTMAKLAQLEGSAEGVKKHQATVLVG